MRIKRPNPDKITSEQFLWNKYNSKLVQSTTLNWNVIL